MTGGDQEPAPSVTVDGEGLHFRPGENMVRLEIDAGVIRLVGTLINTYTMKI